MNIEQLKFQHLSTRIPTLATTRLPTGTTQREEHLSHRRVNSQISIDPRYTPSISPSRKQLVLTQNNLNSSEVQRRLKFDAKLRQQASLLRIQGVHHETTKRLLLYLLSKEKLLLDLVKGKYINTLVHLLQGFIEYSIGTRNSLIFVEILLFTAQVLLALNEYDLSSHLFNQTMILCLHANRTLDTYLMSSLLGLADCCQEQYEMSIKFIKKTLQYAWLHNNKEIENQCYSKLGIGYFYLGNLQKSAFYYQRAINYDHELTDSPIRQSGCDSLLNYLNKNYPKNYTLKLDNLLMSKLQLGIHIDIDAFAYELFKVSEFTPSPRVSSFLSLEQSRKMSSDLKDLSTFRISHIKLLPSILESPDFQNEIYTPKHSSRCYNKLSNQYQIFRSIKESKLQINSYFTNSIDNKLGIIQNKTDMNLFKLSLDKKIEYRLKEKQDIDVNKKLLYYVSSNSKQYEKKSKILLTHMNQENKKKSKQLDETHKAKQIETLFDSLITKLLKQQF